MRLEKKQVEIIGGDGLIELTNIKVLHYSCLMFLNLIKIIYNWIKWFKLSCVCMFQSLESAIEKKTGNALLFKVCILGGFAEIFHR